jgi:integrase
VSSWILKIDLSKISQNDRRNLFEYVIRKGVTYKDLGVDYTYFHRVKTGKYRITDSLLLRILEHLTEEEFRRIVGSNAAEYYGLVKEGVVDYGLALSILDKAKEDPVLQSMILRLGKELEKNLGKKEVIVVQEDVEKFKKLLADRDPKTRSDRVRYLIKALEDMGWTLTPEKIREYIKQVKASSPHLAHHIAKSLKLFIREVLNNPELYTAFKTPQFRGLPKPEILNEDQLTEIARNIEYEGARAFFILLAETGLRVNEVLNLRIGDVDLENRIIYVGKIRKTKRAYITFLHTSTATYLKYDYLPFREKYVEETEPKLRNLGVDVEKWKAKLFPMSEDVLRQHIKKACLKVLGKEIDLRTLRKTFATIMHLKGVPPAVVNMLQGRAPPKEFEVLERSYLAITIEDLRRYYEQYAPNITAKLGYEHLDFMIKRALSKVAKDMSNSNT